MALSSTTTNTNFNQMPYAYLAVKRTAQFMKQVPQQIPQREEPVDLCNCCDFDKRYVHLAVASTSDTDTYKNDYCSQLFDCPDSSSTIQYKLEKYNGSSFVNTATLTSSYGTEYALGIFTDYPLFAGFKLQWRNVIILHGEGIYRIKTTINTFGSNEIFYSDAYCLKEYSEAATGQTVRFEWNNNGIVSYSDDDFVRIDYGNINWQDMIRVTGSFGYASDEQEVVDLEFFSGNALKRERIHDKTNYKYKFKSGYFPFNIHSILKNIAFKSNSLTVTTYGKYDKKSYEQKSIVKDSNGYSPNYQYVYKKFFNVEVDFLDKYSDLGSRINCDESGQNCEPVTIVNTSGDTITTVPSGGTYVEGSGGACANATVSNSNDSYTQSVASGGSLELPDTTVNIYISGSLISTTTIVTLDSETINLYP